MSVIDEDILRKNLRKEENKSYLLEKALGYAVKNGITQEEYEEVMEVIYKLQTNAIGGKNDNKSNKNKFRRYNN